MIQSQITKFADPDLDPDPLNSDPTWKIILLIISLGNYYKGGDTESENNWIRIQSPEKYELVSNPTKKRIRHV